MVDRIGKGSGGLSGPTGPTHATEARKPFEADRTTGVPHSEGVDATQPSALEQLKAGKIDVKEYLEMKVYEATSHLEGLSTGQIDVIRNTLRDRMTTDPELIDLIQRATGRPPSDSE
jgi:hypothetical protein